MKCLARFLLAVVLLLGGCRTPIQGEFDVSVGYSPSSQLDDTPTIKMSYRLRSSGGRG
jgi:hypothetical protein